MGIGKKPVDVCFGDDYYFDEAVSFYGDIDEYIDLIFILETGYGRLFLSIHQKKKSVSKFFMRFQLGKNMFQSIVKRVCQTEKISGTGSNSVVTTHSLRGTLATLL